MAERLVVIGGDAAGMSAATQVRRRHRHREIVVLEQGRFTSYSACGIPYLIGGEVSPLEALVARSPQEFRDRHLIDVRVGHRATAVDLDQRTVEVRDEGRDRTIELGFDQLMVATGARPVRPDLPGIDSDWVRGVQTLEDADGLVSRADGSRCSDVVVVGAGYIGLEMAEAFVRRGARVTLVEGGDQVMRTLDPDMADIVATAVRSHGIELLLGQQVQGFEPGRVLTAAGPLPADLVVLGLGVAPNAELAGDAGVPLGAGGAVEVDRRQATGVDGVWSAGDCADTYHQVSRRRVYVALGTVANKGGRVAGINIGGGYASFPGVVGTAITKVCATEVARTGLTEAEAELAGFSFVASRIETTTRAGYMPDTPTMTLKLLAERQTGRVLGAQIVGGPGSAKRIDTVATALTAGMDVDNLVDLDLAYAPPFASVWDPVQVAARDALRLLDVAGG